MKNELAIKSFKKEHGIDDDKFFGGSLDLEGCTLPDGLKLPETIGGYLYLRGCTLPDGLKLPETIGGSLDLEGCTLPDGLKLPETIGGSLDLEGCTLPDGLKLPETIGGSLDLEGCTLPDGLKLPETIGGYLYLRGCTLPDGLKLPETIGGSLYLEGCTLPDGLKLPETIGGSLYLEGCTLPDGLKLPEENKPIPLIKWVREKVTYILCDSRFSQVVSQKGNVWRLKDIGKDKQYFLVTDGNGKYAHGDTIKEAKDDLIYKISERDKSQYRDIPHDQKMKFEKAIEMYRVITGACSAGVKNFIETKGLKKQKYSIADVAQITEGAYGSSTFKSFFNI